METSEEARPLMISRIGEKWLEWVDEPLSPEHILESITLYWLTETFPRSIYTYRQVSNFERSLIYLSNRSNTSDQNFPPPPIPATNDPRWYIHKPFGFSFFPRELAPLPRSWIETTGNLVYWEQHKKVS
jgi:microsomal epoxide hydrolase